MRLEIKILSVFLCTALLAQDVVFARGSEQRMTEIPSNAWPMSVMGITAHSSANPGRMVYGIQDAHGSIDAQRSIAETLQTLIKHHDVRLVGIEGTHGVIDTSIVDVLPDAEMRRKVSDSLLKQSRISAAEYAKIIGAEDGIELYGVEELDVYRKNGEVYGALLKNGEAVRNELSKVYGILKRMESQRLPAWAVDLNAYLESESSQKQDFNEQWKNIESLAAQAGIAHEEFPELQTLFRILKLEATIDFQRANAERQSLIEVLRGRMVPEEFKKLSAAALEFRLGKVSPAGFMRQLTLLANAQRVDWTNYPQLAAYTGYSSLYERVNVVTVLDEAQRIAELIKKKLLTSEQDVLDLHIHAVRVMGRMLEARITPKDYEFFLSHTRYFDIAFIEAFLGRECLSGNLSCGEIRLKDLRVSFADSKEFYRIAKERDAVMLNNLIVRMKEKGQTTAAIVTGGFHAPGIGNLLDDQNISHVIFMPKFSNVEGERPYAEIFTRKGSFLDATYRRQSFEETIALGLVTMIQSGTKPSDAPAQYAEAFRSHHVRKGTWPKNETVKATAQQQEGPFSDERSAKKADLESLAAADSAKNALAVASALPILGEDASDSLSVGEMHAMIAGAKASSRVVTFLGSRNQYRFGLKADGSMEISEVSQLPAGHPSLPAAAGARLAQPGPRRYSARWILPLVAWTAVFSTSPDAVPQEAMPVAMQNLGNAQERQAFWNVFPSRIHDNVPLQSAYEIQLKASLQPSGTYQGSPFPDAGDLRPLQAGYIEYLCEGCKDLYEGRRNESVTVDRGKPILRVVDSGLERQMAALREEREKLTNITTGIALVLSDAERKSKEHERLKVEFKLKELEHVARALILTAPETVVIEKIHVANKNYDPSQAEPPFSFETPNRRWVRVEVPESIRIPHAALAYPSLQVHGLDRDGNWIEVAVERYVLEFNSDPNRAVLSFRLHLPDGLKVEKEQLDLHIGFAMPLDQVLKIYETYPVLEQEVLHRGLVSIAGRQVDPVFSPRENGGILFGQAYPENARFNPDAKPSEVIASSSLAEELRRQLSLIIGSTKPDVLKKPVPAGRDKLLIFGRDQSKNPGNKFLNKTDFSHGLIYEAIAELEKYVQAGGGIDAGETVIMGILLDLVEMGNEIASRLEAVQNMSSIADGEGVIVDAVYAQGQGLHDHQRPIASLLRPTVTIEASGKSRVMMLEVPKDLVQSDRVRKGDVVLFAPPGLPPLVSGIISSDPVPASNVNGEMSAGYWVSVHIQDPALTLLTADPVRSQGRGGMALEAIFIGDQQKAQTIHTALSELHRWLARRERLPWKSIIAGENILREAANMIGRSDRTTNVDFASQLALIAPYAGSPELLKSANQLIGSMNDFNTPEKSWDAFLSESRSMSLAAFQNGLMNRIEEIEASGETLLSVFRNWARILNHLDRETDQDKLTSAFDAVVDWLLAPAGTAEGQELTLDRLYDVTSRSEEKEVTSFVLAVMQTLIEQQDAYALQRFLESRYFSNPIHLEKLTKELSRKETHVDLLRLFESRQQKINIMEVIARHAFDENSKSTIESGIMMKVIRSNELRELLRLQDGRRLSDLIVLLSFSEAENLVRARTENKELDPENPLGLEGFVHPSWYKSISEIRKNTSPDNFVLGLEWDRIKPYPALPVQNAFNSISLYEQWGGSAGSGAQALVGNNRFRTIHKLLAQESMPADLQRSLVNALKGSLVPEAFQIAHPSIDEKVLEFIRLNVVPRFDEMRTWDGAFESKLQEVSLRLGGEGRGGAAALNAYRSALVRMLSSAKSVERQNEILILLGHMFSDSELFGFEKNEVGPFLQHLNEALLLLYPKDEGLRDRVVRIFKNEISRRGLIGGADAYWNTTFWGLDSPVSREEALSSFFDGDLAQLINELEPSEYLRLQQTRSLRSPLELWMSKAEGIRDRTPHESIYEYALRHRLSVERGFDLISGKDIAKFYGASVVWLATVMASVVVISWTYSLVRGVSNYVTNYWNLTNVSTNRQKFEERLDDIDLQLRAMYENDYLDVELTRRIKILLEKLQPVSQDFKAEEFDSTEALKNTYKKLVRRSGANGEESDSVESMIAYLNAQLDRRDLGALFGFEKTSLRTMSREWWYSVRLGWGVGKVPKLFELKHAWKRIQKDLEDLDPEGEMSSGLRQRIRRLNRSLLELAYKELPKAPSDMRWSRKDLMAVEGLIESASRYRSPANIDAQVYFDPDFFNNVKRTDFEAFVNRLNILEKITLAAMQRMDLESAEELHEMEVNDYLERFFVSKQLSRYGKSLTALRAGFGLLDLAEAMIGYKVNKPSLMRNKWNVLNLWNTLAIFPFKMWVYLTFGWNRWIYGISFAREFAIQRFLKYFRDEVIVRGNLAIPGMFPDAEQMVADVEKTLRANFDTAESSPNLQKSSQTGYWAAFRKFITRLAAGLFILIPITTTIAGVIGVVFFGEAFHQSWYVDIPSMSLLSFGLMFSLMLHSIPALQGWMRFEYTKFISAFESREDAYAKKHLGGMDHTIGSIFKDASVRKEVMAHVARGQKLRTWKGTFKEVLSHIKLYLSHEIPALGELVAGILPPFLYLLLVSQTHTPLGLFGLTVVFPVIIMLNERMGKPYFKISQLSGIFSGFVKKTPPGPGSLDLKTAMRELQIHGLQQALDKEKRRFEDVAANVMTDPPPIDYLIIHDLSTRAPEVWEQMDEVIISNLRAFGLSGDIPVKVVRSEVRGNLGGEVYVARQLDEWLRGWMEEKDASGQYRYPHLRSQADESVGRDKYSMTGLQLWAHRRTSPFLALHSSPLFYPTDVVFSGNEGEGKINAGQLAFSVGMDLAQTMRKKGMVGMVHMSVGDVAPKREDIEEGINLFTLRGNYQEAIESLDPQDIVLPYVRSASEVADKFEQHSRPPFESIGTQERTFYVREASRESYYLRKELDQDPALASMIFPGNQNAQFRQYSVHPRSWAVAYKADNQEGIRKYYKKLSWIDEHLNDIIENHQEIANDSQIRPVLTQAELMMMPATRMQRGWASPFAHLNGLDPNIAEQSVLKELIRRTLDLFEQPDKAEETGWMEPIHADSESSLWGSANYAPDKMRGRYDAGWIDFIDGHRIAAGLHGADQSGKSWMGIPIDSVPDFLRQFVDAKGNSIYGVHIQELEKALGNYKLAKKPSKKEMERWLREQNQALMKIINVVDGIPVHQVEKPGSPISDPFLVWHEAQNFVRGNRKTITVSDNFLASLISTGRVLGYVARSNGLDVKRFSQSASRLSDGEVRLERLSFYGKLETWMELDLKDAPIVIEDAVGMSHRFDRLSMTSAAYVDGEESDSYRTFVVLFSDDDKEKERGFGFSVDAEIIRGESTSLRLTLGSGGDKDVRSVGFLNLSTNFVENSRAFDLGPMAFYVGSHTNFDKTSPELGGARTAQSLEAQLAVLKGQRDEVIRERNELREDIKQVQEYSKQEIEQLHGKIQDHIRQINEFEEKLKQQNVEMEMLEIDRDYLLQDARRLDALSETLKWHLEIVENYDKQLKKDNEDLEKNVNAEYGHGLELQSENQDLKEKLAAERVYIQELKKEVSLSWRRIDFLVLHLLALWQQRDETIVHNEKLNKQITRLNGRLETAKQNLLRLWKQRGEAIEDRFQAKKLVGRLMNELRDLQTRMSNLQDFITHKTRQVMRVITGLRKRLTNGKGGGVDLNQVKNLNNELIEARRERDNAKQERDRVKDQLRESERQREEYRQAYIAQKPNALDEAESWLNIEVSRLRGLDNYEQFLPAATKFWDERAVKLKTAPALSSARGVEAYNSTLHQFFNLHRRRRTELVQEWNELDAHSSSNKERKDKLKTKIEKLLRDIEQRFKEIIHASANGALKQELQQLREMVSEPTAEVEIDHPVVKAEGPNQVWLDVEGKLQELSRALKAISTVKTQTSQNKDSKARIQNTLEALRSIQAGIALLRSAIESLPVKDIRRDILVFGDDDSEERFSLLNELSSILSQTANELRPAANSSANLPDGIRRNLPLGKISDGLMMMKLIQAYHEDTGNDANRVLKMFEEYWSQMENSHDEESISGRYIEYAVLREIERGVFTYEFPYGDMTSWRTSSTDISVFFERAPMGILYDAVKFKLSENFEDKVKILKDYFKDKVLRIINDVDPTTSFSLQDHGVAGVFSADRHKLHLYFFGHKPRRVVAVKTGDDQTHEITSMTIVRQGTPIPGDDFSYKTKMMIELYNSDEGDTENFAVDVKLTKELKLTKETTDIHDIRRGTLMLTVEGFPEALASVKFVFNGDQPRQSITIPVSQQALRLMREMLPIGPDFSSATSYPAQESSKFGILRGREMDFLKTRDGDGARLSIKMSFDAMDNMDSEAKRLKEITEAFSGSKNDAQTLREADRLYRKLQNRISQFLEDRRPVVMRAKERALDAIAGYEGEQYEIAFGQSVERLSLMLQEMEEVGDRISDLSARIRANAGKITLTFKEEREAIRAILGYPAWSKGIEWKIEHAQHLVDFDRFLVPKEPASLSKKQVPQEWGVFRTLTVALMFSGIMIALWACMDEWPRRGLNEIWIWASTGEPQWGDLPPPAGPPIVPVVPTVPVVVQESSESPLLPSPPIRPVIQPAPVPTDPPVVAQNAQPDPALPAPQPVDSRYEKWKRMWFTGSSSFLSADWTEEELLTIDGMLESIGRHLPSSQKELTSERKRSAVEFADAYLMPFKEREKSKRPGALSAFKAQLAAVAANPKEWSDWGMPDMIAIMEEARGKNISSLRGSIRRKYGDQGVEVFEGGLVNAAMMKSALGQTYPVIQELAKARREEILKQAGRTPYEDYGLKANVYYHYLYRKALMIENLTLTSDPRWENEIFDLDMAFLILKVEPYIFNSQEFASLAVPQKRSLTDGIIRFLMANPNGSVNANRQAKAQLLANPEAFAGMVAQTSSPMDSLMELHPALFSQIKDLLDRNGMDYESEWMLLKNSPVILGQDPDVERALDAEFLRRNLLRLSAINSRQSASGLTELAQSQAERHWTSFTGWTEKVMGLYPALAVDPSFRISTPDSSVMTIRITTGIGGDQEASVSGGIGDNGKPKAPSPSMRRLVGPQGGLGTTRGVNGLSAFLVNGWRDGWYAELRGSGKNISPDSYQLGLFNQEKIRQTRRRTQDRIGKEVGGFPQDDLVKRIAAERLLAYALENNADLMDAYVESRVVNPLILDLQWGWSEFLNNPSPLLGELAQRQWFQETLNGGSAHGWGDQMVLLPYSTRYGQAPYINRYRRFRALLAQAAGKTSEERFLALKVLLHRLNELDPLDENGWPGDDKAREASRKTFIQDRQKDLQKLGSGKFDPLTLSLTGRPVDYLAMEAKLRQFTEKSIADWSSDIHDPRRSLDRSNPFAEWAYEYYDLLMPLARELIMEIVMDAVVEDMHYRDRHYPGAALPMIASEVLERSYRTRTLHKSLEPALLMVKNEGFELNDFVVSQVEERRNMKREDWEEWMIALSDSAWQKSTRDYYSALNGLMKGEDGGELRLLPEAWLKLLMDEAVTAVFLGNEAMTANRSAVLALLQETIAADRRAMRETLRALSDELRKQAGLQVYGRPSVNGELQRLEYGMLNDILVGRVLEGKGDFRKEALRLGDITTALRQNDASVRKALERLKLDVPDGQGNQSIAGSSESKLRVLHGYLGSITHGYFESHFSKAGNDGARLATPVMTDEQESERQEELGRAIASIQEIQGGLGGNSIFKVYTNLLKLKGQIDKDKSVSDDLKKQLVVLDRQVEAIAYNLHGMYPQELAYEADPRSAAQNILSEAISNLERIKEEFLDLMEGLGSKWRIEIEQILGGMINLLQSRIDFLEISSDNLEETSEGARLATRLKAETTPDIRVIYRGQDLDEIRRLKEALVTVASQREDRKFYLTFVRPESYDEGFKPVPLNYVWNILDPENASELDSSVFLEAGEAVMTFDSGAVPTDDELLKAIYARVEKSGHEASASLVQEYLRSKGWRADIVEPGLGDALLETLPPLTEYDLNRLDALSSIYPSSDALTLSEDQIRNVKESGTHHVLAMTSKVLEMEPVELDFQIKLLLSQLGIRRDQLKTVMVMTKDQQAKEMLSRLWEDRKVKALDIDEFIVLENNSGLLPSLNQLYEQMRSKNLQWGRDWGSLDIRVAFEEGEFVTDRNFRDNLTVMAIEEGGSNLPWVISLFTGTKGSYFKLNALNVREKIEEVFRSDVAARMSA